MRGLEEFKEILLGFLQQKKWADIIENVVKGGVNFDVILMPSIRQLVKKTDRTETEEIELESLLKKLISSLAYKRDKSKLYILGGLSFLFFIVFSLWIYAVYKLIEQKEYFITETFFYGKANTEVSALRH